MQETTLPAYHECGRKVYVIEGNMLPHFRSAGLDVVRCPRCQRNLINDWMDEQWRFWTPEAWRKLGLWRQNVNLTEPLPPE